MITVNKHGTEIHKPDGNEMGLLKTRKNRETGFYVSLYRSAESGMENDPDLPYATVCEQHATLVCHKTRKSAEGWLSDPRGWCEECRPFEVFPIMQSGHWFTLYAKQIGNGWNYELRNSSGDLVREGVFEFSSRSDVLKMGTELIKYEVGKIGKVPPGWTPGTYSITEEEAEKILSEGEQKEDSAMSKILDRDWESMMQQAEKMEKADVLDWLRVLNARLGDIIAVEEESFLEGLEPEELLLLPAASLNKLAGEHYVLNVGEAQEALGFSGRESVYSAANVASNPLRNIQIGATRPMYYFTQGWINDYKANNPGRGRRKKSD
jgi:hypothetical protein